MIDKIQVLLIEDDLLYAKILEKILDRQSAPAFEVIHARSLVEGLKALTSQTVDAVLLDLSLPDSTGINTLIRVNTEAESVPIVVLTGDDNDRIADEAVRRGAQDYLVKGDVDGKTISRVIRYSMERHQMQEELKSLSLIDELTGLYNRRGFNVLAKQHFKLVLRKKKSVLLFFIDLDGLKRINDQYGHQAGDFALSSAATILKETFRDSDIKARWGGDEFAVLAIDFTEGFAEVINARLKEHIDSFNQSSQREFKLALSVGTVGVDPDNPIPLEEVLKRADQALYEGKRSK